MFVLDIAKTFPMATPNIPELRLHAQQIAHSYFKEVTELVSHMGVLQAQDFQMVKWAIGLRVPGTTAEDIDNLIQKGKLLRTHLLRPTWHMVADKDIYWLLELTAPRIIAAQKWRHKELGLTDTILKKSLKVMEKAFKETKQLTREELIEELEKAKIATNENRASHLLFMAELDGLLCSGSGKGQRTSYRLLSETVKKPTSISKEEAMAKLTTLYFTSRGPATLEDFMNWSGFAITEVKKAMEELPSHLISETIGENTYWWSDKAKIHLKEKGQLHLLPSFDEYIIGYKDRSAVLQEVHHKTAVSNNGIFWPTIVLDGQVIGIWKRTIKKETLEIKPSFFDKATKSSVKLLEAEAKHYGEFLHLKPEVIP